MKKKSNKVNNEEKPGILSEKIISEARKNLVEEPNKIDDKHPILEQSDISITRKSRIWERIGNKNKVANEENINPLHINKRILDSKEIDEIINNIDKNIGKESSELNKKDIDKINREKLEILKIVEPSQIQDVEECEDFKTPKKFGFFKKKESNIIQSTPKKINKKKETNTKPKPDTGIYSSKESILKIDHIVSIKGKKLKTQNKNDVKESNNETIIETQQSGSIDVEIIEVDKETSKTQSNFEPLQKLGVEESENNKMLNDGDFLKKKDVDKIQSINEKNVEKKESQKPSSQEVNIHLSKESVLYDDYIKILEDKEIKGPKIENAEDTGTEKINEDELIKSIDKENDNVNKETPEIQEITKSSSILEEERSEKTNTTKKGGLFKRKKDIDVQSAPKNLTTSEDIKEPSKSNVIYYSSKNSTVKDSQDYIKKKEIKTDTTEGNIREKKIEKLKEYLGASKPKFPFFNKQKYSNNKPLDYYKKLPGPKEYAKKLIFRVDNIPQKEKSVEEQAKCLEGKMKDSLTDDNSTMHSDKAETKAILFSDKQLKERELTGPENEKKLDFSTIQTGVLFSDENSKYEHVFFDEEDPSFKGWAPKLTEKEKEMILALMPQKEVKLDNQKVADDIELSKVVFSNISINLTDLGFSEEEWEELDSYSIHEPFAYVEILREKESLDKCYFLAEVALTGEEENILAYILDTMASLEINTDELEEKGDDKYLIDRIDEIINEYNIKINNESRRKIFYYIGKTSLGLGKIDPLLKDPNIEDISCDGIDVPIFLYHRKYGSLRSNVKFDDEEELSSFIFKLAQKCGRHISIAEPMLDATMPDGSRIQMTLSDEITTKGSTFTIRKFRADPFSPPDLLEFNTMSSEMIAYMWLAFENGINTLFVGGTASGKTTTLNALALFIPRESKIVSIEETREINLPHPNWIPGVSRSGFGEVVADKVVGEIDMYDLMKAALRQRPEYILVGEIRGREAYVLFQAMATGHATYSTAHSDSAQSLIHRLEGKPINIPRVMLQSLDIVCLHVITRVKNFRARRCKQIIEIIDIDPTTKEVLTKEVFHWDPIEDKYVYSGKSYVLERIRAEKDMSKEEMTDELKNRMKIVEWMNKNNVRGFRDVSKIVAQYTESPQDTLKIIEKDDKK